ncbi:MAG: hypothetical protein KDE46_31315, partial [Caldilineaceae bacterium]|nr:hypothetical protein [Caldilineaceae bacterium]
MNIQITPEEIAADRMSPDKMVQAVDAIMSDGYVILDNAVDHDHLDILHERMRADSDTLIKAEKWGGAGRR